MNKQNELTQAAELRQSVSSKLLGAEQRRLEEEFISGYLCAIQVLAIAFNEDSLAENIIAESGFSRNKFLKAQKKTDFYTPKMNKIIRSAFS